MVFGLGSAQLNFPLVVVAPSSSKLPRCPRSTTTFAQTRTVDHDVCELPATNPRCDGKSDRKQSTALHRNSPASIPTYHSGPFASFRLFLGTRSTSSRPFGFCSPRYRVKALTEPDSCQQSQLPVSESEQHWQLSGSSIRPNVHPPAHSLGTLWSVSVLHVWLYVDPSMLLSVVPWLFLLLLFHPLSLLSTYHHQALVSDRRRDLRAVPNGIEPDPSSRSSRIHPVGRSPRLTF